MLRSLLIVSLLAGGAANAYYAADNDDTYDRLKPCPDHNPHTDLEELCVDVKWLRDSEIAIAVSYFRTRILIQSLSSYYPCPACCVIIHGIVDECISVISILL